MKGDLFAMNRLFSLDGKLFHILSRIADLILLNVLWLVTSLPVITIGASTTALYYVMLKIIKNEESYIIKSYFHSFRQNIRQSTTIWLFLLTVGTVIYYDSYICSQITGFNTKPLQALLLFIELIIFAVAFYSFPVLARFDNSTCNILKNALLMASAHLPYTFILFLLYGGPILLMIQYPLVMIGGIFFYLFIGISITAWISSFLLRRILDRYTI